MQASKSELLGSANARRLGILEQDMPFNVVNKLSLIHHPFEILHAVVPCVAKDIFHQVLAEPAWADFSGIISCVSHSRDLTSKTYAKAK